MRANINILDTLLLLGSVSDKTLPFYETDLLAITILEYQKLENIQSSEMGKPISMLFSQACPTPLEEASLFEANQIKLWKEMSSSKRYENLRLMEAVGETTGEGKDAEQYAAALFSNNGDNYLVYRGTDESLTGWKEDFNLAFEDEIPAEKRALEGLERIASGLDNITLLGHSKGGTLALYAALKAGEEVFSKIKGIYIFDAPGLPDSLAAGERWERIKNITRSYIPSSSIVGMLFNTIPDRIVVKSSSLGLFQHDAFTWLFSGGKFMEKNDITRRSRLVDETVKNFLSMTPRKERETLVEVLYKILKAAEEENVWHLGEAAIKRIPEIKKTIDSLSEEERKTLMSILLILEEARRETRRRN